MIYIHALLLLQLVRIVLSIIEQFISWTDQMAKNFLHELISMN